MGIRHSLKPGTRNSQPGTQKASDFSPDSFYNKGLMKKTSIIYFSRSSRPRPFLEKVLDIFGDKIRGKILLKPNLVSGEPYPTTTDPELFQELIRLIKSNREISAGDAPAADLLRPGPALKNHPLTKVASEQGIKFYDFYQEEMISKTTPLGDRLKFSALPQKFDLIISLPVLKSHLNVQFTGALKNQFGFLDRKERFRVHFQNPGLLDRAIVGINQLAPAHLFIVDFRETLLKSNEVRHGGTPAKGGWIFAGEDAVALDYFGFSLLQEIEPKLFGKKPEEIKYLRLAEKAGLGKDKFELMEI